MISLRINPVAKPRMTRRDVWKHRPIVDKYYAFKDELVELCKKEGFELGERYHVEFLIKMPETWSNKRKKEMMGKPHQNKPDLDNLLKSLNDCLRKEDKEVWNVDASKIWWDEGRIVILNRK